MNSNASVARLLLASGADVEIRNNKWNTALVLAVQSNSYDTVALLIQKGADASVINKAGQTPLDFAFRNDNIKIIKLLRRE